MASNSLDQAARNMGFRDYATFQAYQAQQQALRSGIPVGQAPPHAAPVQPQPAPENWLQRLINYTPLGGAMQRVRKALP